MAHDIHTHTHSDAFLFTHTRKDARTKILFRHQLSQSTDQADTTRAQSASLSLPDKLSVPSAAAIAVWLLLLLLLLLLLRVLIRRKGIRLLLLLPRPHSHSPGSRTWPGARRTTRRVCRGSCRTRTAAIGVIVALWRLAGIGRLLVRLLLMLLLGGAAWLLGGVGWRASHTRC